MVSVGQYTHKVFFTRCIPMFEVIPVKRCLALIQSIIDNNLIEHLLYSQVYIAGEALLTIVISAQ